MSNKRIGRKIAVTMGDPAGIGPEVVVKSIDSLLKRSELNYSDVTVIGDAPLLYKAYKSCGLSFKFDKLNILETRAGLLAGIKAGECSEVSGDAAFSFIKKSVDMARNKLVDAVVTAPISKHALFLAGLDYPGHTEILKDLCGVKKVEMAFYGKRFCLLLGSRHVSLIDALKSLDINSVYSSIINSYRFLRSLYPHSEKTEIIVTGVNPHASENGLFGSEEKNIIVPAVNMARETIAGIEADMPAGFIKGPLPADTAFYMAANSANKSVVVSHFHDHGLIAFKLLHFASGVNVTLGLPFVRTSPDHGTAFEIASAMTASCSSMSNAIRLALKIKPVEVL